MNWEVIAWFAALLAFIMMEGATVTMVSAWFAIGSLAALIAALLHAPLWLQIVLFLAVSVLCLFLLRPFAKKLFNNHTVKTNVESVVGQTGKVTEEIRNVDAQGRVKLGSMSWAARSTGGADIRKDTLVKVDRVEGVKVYVTPVPDNKKD